MKKSRRIRRLISREPAQTRKGDRRGGAIAGVLAVVFALTMGILVTENRPAASEFEGHDPESAVDSLVELYDSASAEPDEVDPTTLNLLASREIGDHLVASYSGRSPDGVARAVSYVFVADSYTGEWYPSEGTEQADNGEGWAHAYALPDGTEVVAFGRVGADGVSSTRVVAESRRAEIGEQVPSGSGVVLLDELGLEQEG